MKKNRLREFCAYCLFGLATKVQAQPPAELPKPGEVTLSINARGGAYQRLDMPLMENDQGSIILSIASVNDDQQWGPTSNLCVAGRYSKEQACLKFAKLKRDAKVLNAMKEIGLATGKALLSSDTLPGSFRVGEKIKVELRLGADSVTFRINDGDPIVQGLSFTPRILRLGCSSALCAYHVK